MPTTRATSMVCVNRILACSSFCSQACESNGCRGQQSQRVLAAFSRFGARRLGVGSYLDCPAADRQHIHHTATHRGWQSLRPKVGRDWWTGLALDKYLNPLRFCFSFPSFPWPLAARLIYRPMTPRPLASCTHYVSDISACTIRVK